MIRTHLRTSCRACAGVLISCTFYASFAHAADFYVDPVSGAADNDGSEAHPWQTLESVVTAGHFGTTIRAGDQVWLKNGYHGAFEIRGGSYATPIRISAAPAQIPSVSHVSMSDTSGWNVDGLTISPSYDATLEPLDMVFIDSSSSYIIIEGCRAFSVEDTSAWSASDWIHLPSSGASVRGSDVTLRNNTFTNVRFGISVDGTNAVIENNQIVNFSADGLRGLGDYGVFEYNLVKNAYVDDAAGDTNHDDGFQSWSVGPDGPGDGVVTGIVLRGNVFINHDDPNRKFPNAMQGIGCFDGMFDDWVVENNVVITNHWHGISFYGLLNSRIVNNTVIDVDDVSPGPPWIMVTAHKDGTSSQNVTVRNNLATDFDLSGQQVVDDHNTTLTVLGTYFVDPSHFDLRLLPTSPAIDVGSAEGAPALDADRILRPQGLGVDLGAYEWHEPSVAPVGGQTSHGGNSANGGTATVGSDGGVSMGASAGSKSDNPAATGHDHGCNCALRGSPQASFTRSALVLVFLLGLRRRVLRQPRPLRKATVAGR